MVETCCHRIICQIISTLIKVVDRVNYHFLLTLFSPCNIIMLFITMTNNYCTKFINTLMILNPTRVSVLGGPSSGVTVVKLVSFLSLHVVMVSSGTLHFVITTECTALLLVVTCCGRMGCRNLAGSWRW
jgi:hypothetical protein